MEKLRVVLVVSIFALLAAGCGGGSSTSSENQTPSVTVSLSELTATIEISTTHQFSATVENAEDTSVTWKVNNVTGGNSSVGTILESGLYTAPDRVPSPTTVTVTAAARADGTKTASATVTIMSNVTIAVSPKEGLALPAGQTLQLAASVEHAQDKAVSWKVNDVAGGSAALGTISSGSLHGARTSAGRRQRDDYGHCAGRYQQDGFRHRNDPVFQCFVERSLCVQRERE